MLLLVVISMGFLKSYTSKHWAMLFLDVSNILPSHPYDISIKTDLFVLCENRLERWKNCIKKLGKDNTEYIQNSKQYNLRRRNVELYISNLVLKKNFVQSDLVNFIPSKLCSLYMPLYDNIEDLTCCLFVR